MENDAIVVYGAIWCGDCHRARRLLDQYRARYTWIDVDGDPGAQAEVVRLNRGLRIVPTIVFPDGSFLAEPSNRELSERLQALPKSPTAEG